MEGRMIELGIVPETLAVHLPTGSDFATTVHLDDGSNWPVGAGLAIVFSDGTTWAATITGPNAAWSVDKAVADAVPAGMGVTLVFTNGSTDEVWAQGTVKRHG